MNYDDKRAAERAERIRRGRPLGDTATAADKKAGKFLKLRPKLKRKPPPLLVFNKYADGIIAARRHEKPRYQLPELALQNLLLWSRFGTVRVRANSDQMAAQARELAKFSRAFLLQFTYGLARSIALKSFKHLPFEQRETAALSGVLEALRRFDGGSPGGFIEMAKQWARKELQRLAASYKEGSLAVHFPWGFPTWDDRALEPLDIPVTAALDAYYLDLRLRNVGRSKHIVLDRDDPGRTPAGPMVYRGREPMSFRPYYRSLAYSQTIEDIESGIARDSYVSGGNASIEENEYGKLITFDREHPMFQMYDGCRPPTPYELFASKEAWWLDVLDRSANEIADRVAHHGKRCRCPGCFHPHADPVIDADVIRRDRTFFRHWKQGGDDPHRYRTNTPVKDRERLMSRIDTEQRVERATPEWFAVNYPRLRHTEIDIIPNEPITPCLRTEDFYYGNAEGTTIAPTQCSEHARTELARASGDES